MSARVGIVPKASFANLSGKDIVGGIFNLGIRFASAPHAPHAYNRRALGVYQGLAQKNRATHQILRPASL